MNEHTPHDGGIGEISLTRRKLLEAAAASGAAVGAAGLLPQLAAAAEKPKRGGTLRVGHVGGGKGETFNPARGSSFIDASRYYNLYDPLIRINPDLTSSPGLALEWLPNKTSNVWEIKLRPGVKFHNGKPFTADDVIYTFRSMGDPKHVAHSAVTNIRLRDLKKLSPLTLRVPLNGPDARLFDAFNVQNSVVIQNGAKSFAHPIGTGPFMFKSFTPGQRSVCVRNPDYWDHGKPYVDEWQDISIDDDTARLNALVAGQIDMMSQLPYTQARVHKAKGDIQVIDAPSPSIQVILMAVDLAPFKDNRVREAFRLIPNRQALIEGALAGFATAGNDLAGKGLPYFANFPVRHQDLEKAKFLLKQAGAEGLKVTLHTSKIVPGFVEVATLFAQQAKGAGVTVDVKLEPANAYFDTSLLYTKLNFAQSFWTVTALGQWYFQSLHSTAVWNETHWRSKSYDQLLAAAKGATNQKSATALWHKAQAIQYTQGGYIVWANVDLVDGASNKVKGIVPSSFFNLGGWNYRDVWFA